MSLLTESSDVARDIAAVAAARGLADQVHALATRATAITDAANLLQVAVGRTAALKARGVALTFTSPTAGLVRKTLETWHQAVKADPSQAIAAGQQTVQSQILAPVKRLAQALEAAAKTAWKSHATGRLPLVDDEMLKLLADLPGQASRVAAFRQIYQSAIDLTDTPPSSDAEFARFDHRVTQCDTAWRDLDVRDLPGAVRKFLRDAASSSGAALSAFDGEVAAWLETHGWAAKFRIRSR